MANTTTSPNMGMPVPTVSVDPGPDWANNVNSCLSVIDGHNHSSGNGVQVNPAGLNINSDLTFQNNNATNFRSVRLYPQTSPLAVATDLGCLYESGVDLYYNDGNGNQIRITQSGNVAGASGTITGLPSGTASASYSAGTFTFQGATNTPATMAVGPLVIGRAVASSNTVTLAPNSSIASNYNLFFPAALPGALDYMTMDASGNISFNSAGSTGTGAVVLASGPTFSGQPLGTITSGQTNPSATWLGNSPSAITFDFTNYYVIGTIVFVSGQIQFTCAAGGGSGLSLLSIPVATSSLILTGGMFQTDNFYAGFNSGVNALRPSGHTAIDFLTNTPGSTNTGVVARVQYSYAYQII